ncbi:MAG: hypothetical protein ACRD2C_13820 [Acidimicrobiales bacterium]
MALLYRAVWEDRRPRLLDAVEKAAVRWFGEDRGLPVDRLHGDRVAR